MTDQPRRIQRSQEWEGTVTQNNVEVASVVGTNRADVERETMHYAMVYAQDGPVAVCIRPANAPLRCEAGDA